MLWILWKSVRGRLIAGLIGPYFVQPGISTLRVVRRFIQAPALPDLAGKPPRNSPF